jgi:hypothetical protein
MIATRGTVKDGAAGIAAATIGIEPLALQKLWKVSEGGLGNREHVESRFADVFLVASLEEFRQKSIGK